MSPTCGSSVTIDPHRGQRQTPITGLLPEPRKALPVGSLMSKRTHLAAGSALRYILGARPLPQVRVRGLEFHVLAEVLAGRTGLNRPEWTCVMPVKTRRRVR